MSERSRQANELSRTMAVESIGPRAQVLTIETGEGERRRLAERLGLLELPRLWASVELRRLAGDVIHAEGRLIADVVQSCVVTLEPVAAHIETNFACNYSAAFGETAEADIDPLAREEAEPLVGAEIDLGETVTQQLAVALDPYPRAPGAVWPEVEGEGTEPPGATGNRPFAKLAKLKKA